MNDQMPDERPSEPDEPPAGSRPDDPPPRSSEGRRLRAERLRQRTFQAFDTRTERWQRAGLASQIERAEARRALREAAVLLLAAVGILIVFARRQDLFPGYGPYVRYTTAFLLVIVGWGLARAAAKGLGPKLLRRMDPATAGTFGFLIRLVTILVVVFGSLAIAGVDPEVLALGGAFTAVVVGLAAQQSLGNMFAGAMLLSTRPFRVADRIRLQGGMLAGTIEGTVASLGLFYTTLLSDGDRILVPNSTLMQIAVIPLTDPDSVQFNARFDREQTTPSRLQAELEDGISVPLRRPPRIELEEIGADEQITLRITVTPNEATDGARLASEVLAVITSVGGEGQTRVHRATRPVGEDDG
jgi:small conductance mechanosensitive channel